MHHEGLAAQLHRKVVLGLFLEGQATPCTKVQIQLHLCATLTRQMSNELITCAQLRKIYEE